MNRSFAVFLAVLSITFAAEAKPKEFTIGNFFAGSWVVANRQVNLDTGEIVGEPVFAQYNVTKTSDNEKLDESEIVYEYILCSICPVKLSKPGLSYYEKEDEVDLRERDWVVQMPDAGFLYPSFTDRCPDVNECLFYNRKPKEAAHDFMNDLLCCNTDLTASEKKNIFGQILESVAEKESDMEEKIYHMHEELQAIADKKENDDNADDPVTAEDIKEAAKEAGFDDVNADLMAKRYESDLSKTNATAENLVDRKLLDRNDALKQIESLKEQLKTLMAENKRLKEKLGE